MTNDILQEIINQDYPLQISREAADALVDCIGRILGAVSEDDRVFVHADYDLATSALCHPEGDSPRTNEHSPRPQGPQKPL